MLEIPDTQAAVAATSCVPCLFCFAAEEGVQKQSISKQIPAAPYEELLVLDATVGQNCLRQANGFSGAIKSSVPASFWLNGTAKGGVVMPIQEHSAFPIKSIDLGENSTDLAAFHANEFIEALFADWR